MTVEGIKLTWIVVKDLDTALKFYTEIVGLKLLEHNEEYKWAELSGPDGIRLGIAQEHPHMDVKAGMNAIATITVKDLHKSLAQFRKQGVRLIGDVMEVSDVKMQTFQDADGNTFQLVQELTH